jgi:hypothetical protein
MYNSKTLIEFSYNNNTIKVIKNLYAGNSNKYSFVFLNNNNQFKETNHSLYKSIAGVMKQFNKAVDAIKNGTNIK